MNIKLLILLAVCLLAFVGLVIFELNRMATL